MSTVEPPRSAEDLKRCCATVYQHDLVALLLGESYHPGGLALTRRLARCLDLRPEERVLDVASGRGVSAFLLAREFGADVQGLDLGWGSLARARAAAAEEGLAGRVRFLAGDAEQLPFRAGSVDAIVCECSFCTFPDKAAAAREFARVLRPGGRVGITDVVLDPSRLDPELKGLAGWVACLASARPLDDYRMDLEAAGLLVTHAEPHDAALGRMIEEIAARLGALAMLGLPALSGVDLGRARDLAASAARAVRDGVAGYALVVAEGR